MEADMINAGIDVGFENIKIALLDGNKIIALRRGPSGGPMRGAAVQGLWNETLGAAGISPSDVGGIMATGQGKFDVDFAGGLVTEPVADARAARFYDPRAAFTVDIGADQTRVISLDADGGVRRVALNQKCAAGIGVFLKHMARTLEMTLDEMSGLVRRGGGTAVVNDGCPVFAELDAMGLLNRGLPKETVAEAVVRAMAVRICSVLNEKTKPSADSTILIGGVSRNAALVGALKELSGIDFIIPENAEYGGAVGAALLAAA
jgi:predicted CoA-substrate-specific enzyme activase